MLVSKLIDILLAAKQAAMHYKSMYYHIDEIRKETDNTAHEGNVKYSCINLRNAVGYLEALADEVSSLEETY